MSLTFSPTTIQKEPHNLSPRSLYFRDLPARHGGTLAQYVPAKYRSSAAHYDPEFETLTYGDPTRNKRAQLLRLAEGDLLVFYAGLRSVDSSASRRLYIIGYFTVASVQKISTTHPWPPHDVPHLIRNAHLRRSRPDENLVVVSGNPKTSGLMEHAMVISDAAHMATREVQETLGIHGSLKRAIGRWVPEQLVPGAVQWFVREFK